MTFLKNKPTDSELEILRIIWDLETATVKDVNDELSKTKNVGYTTTLKIMQIMYVKGILSRKKDGRSHQYFAKYKEEDTQKFMTNKLVDTLFGGSPGKLVMQALGNSNTTKEELEEIKKIIEKMENENE